MCSAAVHQFLLTTAAAYLKGSFTTYECKARYRVGDQQAKQAAKYSFQYIKYVKRTTTIQGEPYDSRGLLKTKIDNKGNLTTYSYNSRDLEVSRTEASGRPRARTITTTGTRRCFCQSGSPSPTELPPTTTTTKGGNSAEC